MTEGNEKLERPVGEAAESPEASSNGVSDDASSDGASDDQAVPEETAGEASADSAEAGAEDGAQADPLAEAEAKIAELAGALEALQAERQALATSLSRLRADFENMRRRHAQTVEEIKERAAEDLIERLLPVVDNLERALDSTGGAAGSSLAEGVALVHKQLMGVLQQSGLSVVPAVGEEFDPQLHEAVERVEVEDGAAAGRIVEEMQKGYLLAGRLLRPAKVKVAGD